MKKLILVAVVTLLSNLFYAQDFSSLRDSSFDSSESIKSAEPQVLTCANYLLSHPSTENQINRLTALQYIMKWMEATPDYTFDIGSNVMELTDNNQDMLGLYLASMTKVVLENKDEKLSNDAIYDKSVKVLGEYCANPQNNIKLSKKQKKAFGI